MSAERAAKAPTRSAPRRLAKRALLNARIPLRRQILRRAWRSYEHALALREGKRAHQADLPPDADRWPIPPARLRVLVAADADPAFFLWSGKLQAGFIRELVERNGARLERLDTILDFGCGCGRLARWWPPLRGELHGCDYNPELVGWCAQRLPFMKARTSGLSPPLPYRAASFDLIYALSVFTHLPRELQIPWARELRRVLKPGGLLLVTVNGATAGDRLAGSERNAFAGGELVVHFGELPGSNLCAAYHPGKYVETRLWPDLELAELVTGSDERARAAALHQDTYLFRRSV